MIILGRKHSFTISEIKELQKKFNIINTVRYAEREAKEVIDELTNILTHDHALYTAILLNTEKKLDNSIIRFLSKLKYNSKYKHIRLITLEYCFEEYLKKCYIPSSHNDIHLLEDIKELSRLQYAQKKIFELIAIFIISLFTSRVMKKCKQEITKYNNRKKSPYLIKRLVGKHGKEFPCIKFKTSNSKFGTIMKERHYNELPQLLNILKGEMHLIGPKPERKFFIKKFETTLPYYTKRNMIAPGMLGWAQIKLLNFDKKEYRNHTKQKLMYDLYYIKHWSLAFDIKIFFMSLKLLVKQL